MPPAGGGTAPVDTIRKLTLREAGILEAVGAGLSNNRIANELTQALKDLPVEELRAGSEKYKQLLEARELEAALYGGGP
jgi:FixJ family two-component response regulator